MFNCSQEHAPRLPSTLTFDKSLRWFGDPNVRDPHLTQKISFGFYRSVVTVTSSPLFDRRCPEKKRPKENYTLILVSQGAPSGRYRNKNLAQFTSLWYRFRSLFSLPSL